MYPEPLVFGRCSRLTAVTLRSLALEKWNSLSRGRVDRFAGEWQHILACLMDGLDYLQNTHTITLRKGVDGTGFSPALRAREKERLLPVTRVSVE